MPEPEDLNCPNCGTLLPPLLQFAKMVDCTSCGTTILMQDAGLLAAGTHGVMVEAPSLLKLGEEVQIGSARFIPVGHIRFDYGAGWWDEFYCLDLSGLSPVWISADEGDYAFERLLPRSDWPVITGRRVQFSGTDYMLAEQDEATCIAFRGQLPEVIALGEMHHYRNFTGPDGLALSQEVWDGGEAWFAGDWLDPWAIKAAG